MAGGFRMMDSPLMVLHSMLHEIQMKNGAKPFSSDFKLNQTQVLCPDSTQLRIEGTATDQQPGASMLNFAAPFATSFQINLAGPLTRPNMEASGINMNELPKYSQIIYFRGIFNDFHGFFPDKFWGSHG